MDLVTALTMLLAGLLHASWHSLVKSGGDQIANLAGMGLVASIVAIATIPFVPSLPLVVWPIIAVSVCLHVGYKTCLAFAYSKGELGQAFPLSRGAVPVFASVIAFATLGQLPTKFETVGIVLVSIGIVLLAMERLRGSLNGALLLAAAGAGLSVAAYSVLDSYGTRLAGNWIAFTAWLVVLDCLLFLIVARWLRGEKLLSVLFAMKGRIFASGFLGVISFSVFMWALSRSPVGPVTALRETSILFAIIIGVMLHHEQLSVRRLCAGAMMVAGVMTIAIPW